MQEYYLGIDIGTGSAKAVAVDLVGTPFATSQFHYSTFSTQPTFCEQDPEVIWDAFCGCIKEIVDKTGCEPLTICLSSVMHSLIGVNEQGKALTQLITWTDARSAEIAEILRNDPAGRAIYMLTGTPIYSMSPLTKIMWFKSHVPELFTRIFKFISIKEYIWFKLFNEFQIDYSVASATGLFDIINKKWCIEALELAGITAEKLSNAVNTKYLRTDLSALGISRLSLKNSIPFIIGASDGCLANLGTLAISSGCAALTIGTSGAVRIASEHPIPNFEAMTFSYCLDDSTYICGGPLNNGGIAVQWLLKQFLNIESPSNSDYNKLFESIETVEPGCKGLIFLPYLTGERAPVWDTKSCGNFLGVRLHHKQVDFTKAVLEGICFALRQVLEIVDTNHDIDVLHVSGGFTSSIVWIQMLADITGKKICLVSTQDASAVGAVYLGMKALNIIKDYSDITLQSGSTIYPTEKNAAVYNRNYSIFQHLYANLKEPMHRLYADNN